MTLFASKAVAPPSVTPLAINASLFPVVVFCGVGLLVSLLVLILDQHIPGDWF
jgi:hypothetical protein